MRLMPSIDSLGDIHRRKHICIYVHMIFCMYLYFSYLYLVLCSQLYLNFLFVLASISPFRLIFARMLTLVFVFVVTSVFMLRFASVCTQI